MLLLRGLLYDAIELTDTIKNRLYFCSICGICKEKCPPGVDTPTIFREIRENLVEHGEVMENHKQVLTNIQQANNPFGEPHENRLAWIPPDIELPETAETLYFAGCMSSYRTKETAINTVKLLKASGIDFTVSKDEICCGSVLFNTGFTGMAKEFATTVADLINSNGVKNIVTSCAGCYRMLKMEYPETFGLKLNAEIYHTSQLLEKLINEGRLTPNQMNMRVAYHDPCHLGRHMNEYDAPRRVILSIPGIELVEFPESRELTHCCGAGGGVRSAFRDYSVEIAAERVKQANELGVDAIVTACPFCALNLRDGADLIKQNIPVFDLPELIVKACGL